MELIQNSYEKYTVLPQAEQQKEVSLEVIVPDTQADVYSVLTSFALCQVKQKTLRQDCVLVEGTVELAQTNDQRSGGTGTLEVKRADGTVLATLTY